MANDGKRAIFALCVHLCCPNFCHLLLCYDKAQGPFWSPSLSSAISSFPNSGIFKIRDPELQKQTMPRTVHAIQDVIGYGIVVLGTEQNNPNHPNIFMLQHLGNEEWQNCRDSRRKNSCNSHSCHDGWGNENEFGEECYTKYAFATSNTFSQGIFIKFSWVEVGLLISFLKKVDTFKIHQETLHWTSATLMKP